MEGALGDCASSTQREGHWSLSDSSDSEVVSVGLVTSDLGNLGTLLRLASEFVDVTDPVDNDQAGLCYVEFISHFI